MTAMSLFPEVAPVPEVAPASEGSVSAGRKLTQRQHTDVARDRHPLYNHGAVYAAGLVADGHTCGDCQFRQPGRYPKCTYSDTSNVRFPRATRGPATDCRAWWPACTDWRSTTPDAACGDYAYGGHDVFDPDCAACDEADSNAPEWTI